MDLLFKALSDPARRAILDSLRARDGQSLSDLEPQFDMTRFGVMKHLKLLEEANLIVTKRAGRFKYHYLNPLPLQEMLDRWVAPFLQPQTRQLADLKAKLERTHRMGKPDFMMQTFIRCTQDALWDALTQADQMAAYHFMCDEVRGNAIVGQPTDFIKPDGATMFRQVTTELDPKSRIATTFEPYFYGEKTPHSHMVYVIDPLTDRKGGDTCKLTIEHYDMAPGQDGFAEGWARIASSLKSYLETGTPLKGTMQGAA